MMRISDIPATVSSHWHHSLIIPVHQTCAKSCWLTGSLGNTKVNGLVGESDKSTMKVKGLVGWLVGEGVR